MRDPDLVGVAQAWRIKAPEPPVEPDHAGSIQTWVVHGPFHPAWSWWHVSVIHLRPIPGVRPAHKHYPEAEYEFMIVSLNPERGTPDVDAIERGEDWGDASKAKFLIPPDVTVQFHGVSDQQAANICELAVQAIVLGRSPDSDYRAWWENAIEATVEHERAGVHG